MVLLVLGMTIFIGMHAMRIVAPDFRARQLDALGEGPWKGIFAAASLGGLALASWGWSQYRLDAPEIYTPFSWAPHLTALLVLIGFVLNVAAYGPVGRIKALVVHPMMIGILAWSIGHLLANGDLASLILFGGFAAYSVWYLLAVQARHQPAPEFASYTGDAIAIVVGGIAFVVFAFWIHGWLFGISPF